MSGIDDLFPGADRPAAADIPQAGPRRLGLTALVLGAAASALNISAALTLVAAITTALGGGSTPTGNLSWVPAFEVAAVAVAAALGVTALVLGIRAGRLRRGRAPGIVGGILGGIAVAVDVGTAVVAVLFVFAPGV